MSASLSEPVMPKSTRPRRPSWSTMMFAGCGSPWNTPWRKIISSHASAIRIASRRRSSIAVASRSTAPNGAGHLVEQAQVGLDLAGGALPLHLHGDAAAVRELGEVHLADRGGGDG